MVSDGTLNSFAVLLHFIMIMQMFVFALPKISVCVCVCVRAYMCMWVGGQAPE